MKETPEFDLQRSALLIVDMISDFAFPDGAEIASQAQRIVTRIAELRARYRNTGRPVIYVNDNFGQWHAGFSDLLDWASRGGSVGRSIVDALSPERDDYFVLKPKHSIFYETPLPSLLAQLDVDGLAITGVAGDSCVLSSAIDAHMREFKLWIPADGTASLTNVRNERAIAHLRESLDACVGPIDAPGPVMA